MKICHFSRPSPFGEQNRLGILIDEKEILDVNLFWNDHFRQQGFFNYQERANHHAPSSLSAILKFKSEPLAFFQETMDEFERNEKDKEKMAKYLFPLAGSKINAPLDVITSYRDFYAHEQHVAKGFELRNESIPPSWYEIPAYYKGSCHSFIGDGDEILWPSYSRILDYELELAAVVGKDGRNLTEKTAAHHILGPHYPQRHFGPGYAEKGNGHSPRPCQSKRFLLCYRTRNYDHG